jgi:hypothetical protein
VRWRNGVANARVTGPATTFGIAILARLATLLRAARHVDACSALQRGLAHPYCC